MLNALKMIVFICSRMQDIILLNTEVPLWQKLVTTLPTIQLNQQRSLKKPSWNLLQSHETHSKRSSQSQLRNTRVDSGQLGLGCVWCRKGGTRTETSEGTFFFTWTEILQKLLDDLDFFKHSVQRGCDRVKSVNWLSFVVSLECSFDGFIIKGKCELREKLKPLTCLTVVSFHVMNLFLL